MRGWRSLHITDSDHPYMKHWWVPGLQIGYEHSFIHQAADFIDGLKSGTPAAPTFRDGFATDRVTGAVLRSAEDGSVGAAVAQLAPQARRRERPNRRTTGGGGMRGTMAGAVALSLSDLTKTYGSVRALDRLSLEVPEGCFFVLFGPSAVGKTTTLRAISGLVPLDSGTIHIGGRDVTNAPIRGRGVWMVFQSFALYSHLNVFENLGYPFMEDGLPRAEIAQRVGETAGVVKLSRRLQQKPTTLFGRRAAARSLGRSLIHRPKLLLLDEPLTNLDAKLRFDMRAELEGLHRQFGMTVVYATPDELEALSMGEQIAVLRDGRAVQQGSPDDLYETPVDRYVASRSALRTSTSST